MASGSYARTHLAAATFAVAGLVVAPAKAQFMSGSFPVVVVPPPPAQQMVIQKPRPQPAQPVEPQRDTSPSQLNCRYQGKTRVCD